MLNQEPSEIEKLLLIKASAGSGKTHRLTGEYLRLLFSADNHYKNILAVTFTNKATDEMKTRIVEELHTLSVGKKSDYEESLKEEFRLSDLQLNNKARGILENILHDYSSFSISTIDKFFQQTMRAFTREMGLSGGYKIDLDQNFILAQIVDLMILELDQPKNRDLAGWILDYMKSQIADGKSWNIKSGVADLGQQLFNEKYKSLSADNKDQIENKEYLKEYRAVVRNIIKEWVNRAVEIGRSALDIMANHGIDYTDMKYGKNSGFGLFVKWANRDFDGPSNRLIGCAGKVENWTTNKSAKKHEVEAAFYAGLNDCVENLLAHFSNSLHYNTANSILRNFYTLGILNDISNRLRDYQKENNTLFLSDTTELLNKIIADSGAPFIYEKTGTRIANFMIDEFQDTSSMQWQNFRPLIDESLSYGRFNLVVGDVKQSIYRWRNSDWGILENEIQTDFGAEAVTNEVLDTNWRSDANIVNFNNAVFQFTSKMLQADYNSSIGEEEATEHKIMDAYKNVFQLLPKFRAKDEGHVKVSFLSTEDDEEKWQDQALENMIGELELLQDQGFALKDIAILVRYNYEAVAIAEYLLKYKNEHPDSNYRYDVISNEALVIGNAQSVRAAVALIKYFNNREDATKRMLAVYEYNRFHWDFSPSKAILEYFEKAENDFPAEAKEKLDNISSLPFYEMVETFFSIHSDVLDEKENVYVQAFLDIVLKFSTESSSNANDFVEWWEEKGCKKTLFSPDNQDAIRLMTIHKSKGLGFNAVVLPFLNWDIDHKPTRSPIIWCKPSVAPFDMVGSVPLVYAKSLNDTIFNKEYQEEKLYTYIDNLNLLYVAFTRAKNRIVAFAPKVKMSKNGFSNISSLLYSSFSMPNSQDGLISLHNYFDEENDVFEVGTPSLIESKLDKNALQSFDSGLWQSVPFDNRLKLRLSSVDFFSNDGSRMYGTLMHEIISEIDTADDLADAVEARYLSGELEADKKDEILELLSDVLSIDEVADWYSGKYNVINETQVLHPKLGFSRPDRVMIGDDEVVVVDYKFGEVENKKYVKQVQNYVKLISDMGYDNVSGYLFYVTNKTVYKV